MIKTIEATGKTEDEAIEAALAELGINRDDVEVDIEVIERAKTGFLGLKNTPAKVRVSYTIEESKTERVEGFINGLLEKMGVDGEAKVLETEDAINVTLESRDAGALIGRRGETLDAIQHLTNYVINRGNGAGGRLRVNVDAENYRARRNESLEALAKKMADKARKYRRSMTLEPMNSYERHIIHAALQDEPGISTHSVGTDPNRRVVVTCERTEGDDARRDKPAYREWR